MNAIASNAKTSKNRPADNNCFYPDHASRLGEFEKTGSIIGDESNRNDDINCEAQVITCAINGNDVFTGKILSRLKQLESDYIAFLDFHQEKMSELESESRVKRLKIQREIEALEKEIIELISESSDE